MKQFIFSGPVLITGLFFSGGILAQVPYKPSEQAIARNYRRAAHLDSAFRGTIVHASVKPHWMADGHTFWYKDYGKDSALEYVTADAVTGARAVHHEMPKEAGITEKPFNHGPSRWEDPTVDSVSPGGAWTAWERGGNLFVRNAASGAESSLTTDGTNGEPYGAWSWSPDNKWLVAYHIHPVETKKVYYILTSLPGTTRGEVKGREYLQPGDPMPSYQMQIFSLADKKGVTVENGLIDFFGPPRLHWRKDSPYFIFEKVERGHQRFRILEADARSGQTRPIVDEQTNTFIYENRIFTHYLSATGEIIWSSEKDGWYHMYLVDAVKGVIKNVITPGDGVVDQVDSIDEKKRELWFSARGMEPGEDPYDIHYYRIGFDGKDLIRLTAAKGNHQVVWSPDRTYYVDTWSTVNTCPVFELHRTADGKKILDLGHADISAYLATGIRPPELFKAKGRDGKTDIWGIACFPAVLDPSKKYPVIENIYAGPQDSYVPRNFSPYGEMMSLAQLGFIVVQIDGMGTANRSKSFHDVCWKNLADGGFPDRILWIKALGAKYSFVDTARVGLYGTSAGGQNALGALLFHPEFYKAAVAACGCQDNRVDKQWWNEQWMGYPLGPHYEQQSNVTNAWKLKGNLLLIVGEADENVPPESTYRVVDALIKHNKYFDLLVVPGMGHGDGGEYGRKKKRDFFVKHLLGVDPPERNQ